MAKNSQVNGSNSTNPKYERGVLFKVSDYSKNRESIANGLQDLVTKYNAPKIRILFTKNTNKDWAIVSLGIPNEYTSKVLEALKKFSKKYAETVYDSYLCCIEDIDI